LREPLPEDLVVLVGVQGERERANKVANQQMGMALPLKTYDLIRNLAQELGVN
jgi:hypothetical protein